MKKGILLFTSLLGLASLTYAQKLALVEEFSGENCAPCAAANPAFMALLNATGNSSKVLLIKYQSPIPSAGPIYNENTSDVQARMTYYSVPFAPYARLNGAVVFGTGSNAGHIGYATQANIDAAAAETTPFNMTISTPVITGSNFTATVTVTATAAANFSNAKMRFALLEDLEFATPPGSNGETSFHHVMRKMYPTPAGDALQASFTAGQSQTFTVSGTIPAYVSAESPRMFIAWIQNDDTKVVLQAAKTATLPPAANGIASEGLAVTNKIQCGSSATFAPTVTIKNTGSAALTSAAIYVKTGNGTYGAPQQWTGNLAPGATTTHTLQPISITDLGAYAITDSVAMPNGQADAFAGNNVSSTGVYLLNGDEKTMPQANDFETAKPEWIGLPGNGGFPFFEATVASFLTTQVSGSGYNGSAKAISFPFFSIGTGATGFYAMPKTVMSAPQKALDFYVAYCQYQSEGDKLEVVYSTDCGATWTSVWSKSGAQLASRAASTSFFKPNSNSDWRFESVDVSSVPAGARLAFKATSAYGNNLYIDNVALRTGAPTSINNVVKEGGIKLYPSPVQSTLNVEMNMLKSSEVVLSVYNALGQEVKTATMDLNAGTQTANIDVAQLAAGVYILDVKTAEGTAQYKFTKK